MAKQWHRRKGETDKAWAAFQTYCNMPPAVRSLEAAYKSQTGNKGRAASAWKKWSVDNNWVERVTAYDSWCAAQADKGVAKTLEKRRAAHTDSMLDLSERLIAKVEEMLEVPAWAEVEGRDGAVRRVPSQGVTPTAIARLVETVDKVTRLALNMHTDRTEHTGANGAPLVDIDALRKKLEKRYEGE